MSGFGLAGAGSGTGLAHIRTLDGENVLVRQAVGPQAATPLNNLDDATGALDFLGG
jgi:hypothetical protein